MSRHTIASRRSLAGRCRRVALVLVPVLIGSGPARADGPPIDGIEAAGPLAVTRTGQTLSVLERSRRRVLAVDPADAAKRWVAFDAPGDDAATIAAIASLDSSTLLAVWHDDGEWSVRVHRVRPPGEEAGGGATLQSISLGRSTNATPRVRIVVAPSREVLAVAGLPAPLPGLVRGRITGARIEPLSEKRCPSLAGHALRDVAFGPGDEWVLLTTPADAPAGPARLSWVAPGGQSTLLDLDTGLVDVGDTAWDADGGSLYAIGGRRGSATHPRGVWRLDAALENRRQICRARCVARIEDPLALVCLPRYQGVVTRRDGVRIVVAPLSLADEPDPRPGGRGGPGDDGRKAGTAAEAGEDS